MEHTLDKKESLPHIVGLVEQEFTAQEEQLEIIGTEKVQLPRTESTVGNGTESVHDTEKGAQELSRTNKPNKCRLFLRVWQVLAAAGTFGFAYGASPYSGHDFPFSTSGLIYYIYAICLFSLLWSLFNIYVYLLRRCCSGHKILRLITIALDTFLAAMFGVGVFYEIGIYSCPPGAYDGWCNFFDTSLFFCMSLFVTYVVQALWDVFGCLSCRRRH